MTNTSVNPLAAFSDALADAVAKAGQATVLVDARRRHPASGVVFADGLVLTADHVVEREDEIRIGFADGAELSASLAGRDPGSDLAVLRVAGSGFASVEKAAEEGRVGQVVLALGRPSTGGIQASLGVVSSIGGSVRTGRGGVLERYLRTDAIPYPGFSGGPLINANGQVLGINTSGLWQGGSLAIPTAIAWQVADALVQFGRVKRGYLGVRSQPVPIAANQQQALQRDQQYGLLLVGVDEATPAAAGGLLVGDILVSIAGNPVNDPDELSALLVGDLVGQKTRIEVLRGGQPAVVEVIIGERK